MSPLLARLKNRHLGVVLAAGVCSSMLAFAGPATPTQAAAATSSPDLRIGSYNIEINKPMPQFRAAVKFIKSVADVAGLQESGGASRRQYLDGDRSWRIYHPPSLPQDPVIWNPRVFELVSAHQVRLSRATKIEGNHGGLMHWKAMWAPVVHLRQISTGYVFSLINVHLVRAAVNEGRPRRSSPRTYRVYRHQVKALKATVRKEQERGLPVYVTGDFNVGYAADRVVRNRKLPYHRLTSVHLEANWKGKKLNKYGTHIDASCGNGKKYCGAYIDQIWAPEEAATSSVYIHQVHSDHYPIMSTYALRPTSSSYVAPSGTIGFAEDSVSGPEGDQPWQSRQHPLVFHLVGDMTHGFADVQVTNGTAVEGRDFTVDTSSLYDDDDTNNQVVVTTIPNKRKEPDKTFTLTLVNPFDTTITQGTATGVITNDD
jgi:hypothetical protein